MKWIKKNLFTGKTVTSTPRSKEKWHEPVKVDKRSTSAPRKKHFRNLPQKGKRATFGSSLHKGIVNEHKSNYKEDLEEILIYPKKENKDGLEESLIYLNKEVKNIISGLEARANKNNETQ